MSGPSFHGFPRRLSASRMIEAVASDLMRVKHEDALGFADIGHVLGKSEDQVAKYCNATAEMSLSTFGFGKAEWNGRFTGSLDRMIEEARAESTPDRSKATALTKALFQLSLALEGDGEATPGEVAKMRRDLESAKDAIDELLRRTLPRAVTG